MRQSIPRQADKKSWFPEEEKVIWALKEEERTNFFSIYLSKDYITIMYPA